MPFTRQVTIGAVALCNYGADSGKLYVISDVLDLNYVRHLRVSVHTYTGYFSLFDARAAMVCAMCARKRMAVALDMNYPISSFRVLCPLSSLYDTHVVSYERWGDATWGRCRFAPTRAILTNWPNQCWFLSRRPSIAPPSLTRHLLRLTSQALVDRPDEIRRKMNMKRLILTDLKVEMPRLAKKSVLAKAMADADVEAKFAASSWGQKLARREAKKNMTDFDRHCAAVKKMKRSASVRKAYNKLRKSA